MGAHAIVCIHMSMHCALQVAYMSIDNASADIYSLKVSVTDRVHELHATTMSSAKVMFFSVIGSRPG
jgi:hypothetical protein